MTEEKFGEGAFQTTRTIFKHPIWKNVNEFRTFFLIYGKANHSKTPINYGEVQVGRGQWLRSYRQMQKDLEYIEDGTLKRYSLKTIDRIVKKLQDDGRILVKNTNMGTLFTVVNYELYQGFENYRFEVSKHQVNTKETLSKHQVNNNNNDNNDNNEKNEYKVLDTQPKNITHQQTIITLVMPPEEAKFHEILKSIPNYPYNEVTDHQMYLNLSNDFPAVDLVEVVKDWKAYLLDKPLKPKSNPRAQLRNQCKLHLKWGKCLKQQEVARKKVYR